MKKALLLTLCVAVMFAVACNRDEAAQNKETKAAAGAPDAAEIRKIQARFAPTDLRVDLSGLAEGDRVALTKLIEASQLMNEIFMEQIWSRNLATFNQVREDKTELGRARAQYYWMNKSPWSELDDQKAFMPNVPPTQPEGANFYPEDMKKEEFEQWVSTLPEAEQEKAKGFFSVVRRAGDKKLMLVPYSQEYNEKLKRASALLKEAAAATPNPSLKKFLNLRADAFLSDNYYDSDVAWMMLDAPVDVTIGPYETYVDELFGYKAAFESYINLRDEAETNKLKMFSSRMQEIENNLPIPAEHRNAKLGALAPIRVVNEVYAAGHGHQGVQTAAYNLPNDDRIVSKMGSKRIMLKNVQQAKFDKTLIPISKVVLKPEAQADLDFGWFFTSILMHEVTHGLGPQTIKKDGKMTAARTELKELFSPIEEAKADITGLYALQYLIDNKKYPGLTDAKSVEDAERKIYNTWLASSFRTLRFGTASAHARGMALQFNYLRDKGAYILNPDGTFSVDFTKIKGAVRDLTHDLLMLEALGDYNGAKAMLDKLSVIRPEMQAAMDKLKSVPTDVAPNFVTAKELVPAVGTEIEAASK